MRTISARIFLSFLAGKLKTFEQMLTWKTSFAKKLRTISYGNTRDRSINLKILGEWSSAKRKLIRYDSSLQMILKLKILLLMKFVFYLKLNLSFAWVKVFVALFSCLISVDTSIKGILESAWK